MELRLYQSTDSKSQTRCGESNSKAFAPTAKAFLAKGQGKSSIVIPHMKKVFVLSMLVSLAMVCGCQKKDSTAEQQLAQRKAELDARDENLAEKMHSLDEKVNLLDGKMNSLDQRVKELGEKEEAAANARTNPTDVQDQTADPAELQAETERMIQQFSTMIRKPSQLDPAEKQRQLEAGGMSPPHQ